MYVGRCEYNFDPDYWEQLREFHSFSGSVCVRVWRTAWWKWKQTQTHAQAQRGQDQEGKPVVFLLAVLHPVKGIQPGYEKEIAGNPRGRTCDLLAGFRLSLSV